MITVESSVAAHGDVTSQNNTEEPLRQALGSSNTPLLPLTILTLIAVAIHGYHFGADDSAVYLPAVLKILHPSLYPFGADFFLSHARLSLFATIVAATGKLSHLNDEWLIFLWYIATIFAFLLPAWQLASLCFYSARARWSAVVLSALTLTVPVAGTALAIMDPYLTARSASTPLTMLAVAAFLARRRKTSLFWILLTAAVHPQMAVFGATFVAILAISAKWTNQLYTSRPSPQTAVAGAFPAGFSLHPAAPDYRQALDMRPFLFVLRWPWFEWIGVAIPLALLIGFSRFPLRGTTPESRQLARALTIFGLLATLAAIIVSASPNLDTFVRLQPMRAFHLIYIVFFLLLGGVLGEALLNFTFLNTRRRLASSLLGILFFITGAGIFLIQRADYPASRHIEWPSASPINPWLSAFAWIRNNTPKDAVFALDPDYIHLPGEDQHGFRAIAERSVLSDYNKDSGVVSLFPQLATEWAQEQQAQQGWPHFGLADFQRLAYEYPVSWVVLQGTAPDGLDCRYRNAAVTVCRIPGAPNLN